MDYLFFFVPEVAATRKLLVGTVCLGILIELQGSGQEAGVAAYRHNDDGGF